MSSFNTDDNNNSQAINKEILANESKQETAKITIPPLTIKTIMTTTATISSRTQNYKDNKSERTKQGPITNTADLQTHPVNNNTIQKEQDLIKGTRNPFVYQRRRTS